MITFDDGYRDVFFKASPVLARARLPGDRVRRLGPHLERRLQLPTWGQLRALERRGIEIGSHTVAHRDMTSLSSSRLLADLTSSRKALERKLGHRVPWLAYPFGAYDARVERFARRAGYLLAVTTQPGKTQLASRPLALRRLRILDTTGVSGLAAQLGVAGT